MAHKLPDEILKEIISPGLKVPDKVFTNTRTDIPFTPLQSTSPVLAVCKRWLRVATPLLYDVVILRSTAQAQALARVLQANPALGVFIKKLRIDGGYGVAMHKIITFAPNITHFYLTLLIYSQDSVAGLCRAMPAMNPTHVILHDPACTSLLNNQARQLLNTLCACIRNWSNMKVFDLPYHDELLSGSNSHAIANALSKAPHLEVMYAPLAYALPRCVKAISRNPSLKSIVLTSVYYNRSNAHSYTKSVDEDSRLRDIVNYQEPESPEFTPGTQQIVDIPCKPSFVPMATVSAVVKDEIWSLIMKYALGITHDNILWTEPHNLNPSMRLEQRVTRSALPLVSKNFNRLATPIIYTHPLVSGSNCLRSFALRLAQVPALGLHIRTLFLNIWGPWSQDNVGMILAHAPNLTALCGVKGFDHCLLLPRIDLNWEGFEELARTAGPTLLAFRDMHLDTSQGPRSPAVLHRFTSVRSLDWSGATKFNFRPEAIASSCLSTLQSIRFVSYDPSLMEVLSLMDLPALRSVAFFIPFTDALPFLLRHGPKVLELQAESLDGSVPIFDLCPNLTLLTFTPYSPVPQAAWFRCKSPHTALAKIVLARRYRQKHSHTRCVEFFENFDLRAFPALREIQALAGIWPTTEREISKDRWHRWAEDMMRWDVKLTDATGKHWKPRLQKSRH